MMIYVMNWIWLVMNKLIQSWMGCWCLEILVLNNGFSRKLNLGFDPVLSILLDRAEQKCELLSLIFSDILACSFLDDLLELRDEELPKSALEQNWFSAPSALRVYGLYLNLDRDHNGMLSMEELSKLGCHPISFFDIETIETTKLNWTTSTYH